MNINVTKRNKTKEPFNVEKIRQCIDFACDNLEVNALALESLFSENLFEGITTKAIQDNLIHHAKTLCSADEPDWAVVAGRLETMNMWADTKSYRLSFPEFVNEQIRLGIWLHEGLKKYSEDELEELELVLNQELDLNHSYSSVISAQEKYLMSGECIQHMFMGNAMVIASVEPEETRMDFCKEVYAALSERYLSSATPWLSNLRGNGNISSCFILAVADNIGSIFDNIKNAAMISKNGGGIGVFIGKLRAMGSSLMGIDGKSGGVLGWVKLFNDVAIAVNQGGKRAGAITVALPIWHRDIIDFLDCQTEHGDQRRKAYDIQPQITVHDLFMRLKDSDETEWHTFCPHEVKTKLGIDLTECFAEEFEEAYALCVEAKLQGKLKVTETHNAKKLFKLIMKVAFETGLPYLAFVDEINRTNPNKHEGNILCVNLCTESFSNVVPDVYAHTCNLLSLCVGRIPLDKLEYYGGLAAHILDNGIELTKPPIDISRDHNNRYRTIGIGIQGLHDIIAREFKSYEHLDFITEVAERIQYGAVKKSIEIAKRRGAYPAFNGSEWDNGNMIDGYTRNSVVGYDWAALQEEINRYGIRNSQLTSPAPNTSSSIFMDAAAGIMPVYSGFFYESNSNGLLPVVGMYLKEAPFSYSKNVTKYDPWFLPKVVGALQPFVDTGISAEYIMDKNREDFSAKFLWKTFDNAWKEGNKAVYYIRTIKKGEGIVKGAEVCHGCAG